MAERVLTIPVVNALNTRVSAVGSLPTTSGIIGIGIIGLMVIGRAALPSDKDSRFRNCFKHTVKDEAMGGKRVYCVKRSGFAELETVRADHIGNALLIWSGQGSGQKRITAFGNTNSSIYDGTTRLTTDNSDTTSITGLATAITETTLSGTPTIAITSDDNTGWHYQDGGTVTKITDTQWPGNNGRTLAGTMAHLDGFAFQMDTRGDIWNSDLNTLASWTAAGSISASAYPDTGVGCIRWKEYIIGFGTQSMEFFRNAGNPAPGSPLTRVKDMAKKVGAVSNDALTRITDVLFFVGSSPEGGLSVFQFDGSLDRISPSEIDAVLLLAGAANIELTALRDYGLSFLLIKAGATIYAYCIEEKFWFDYVSDELFFCRCAGISTGTSQVIYAISNTSTSGKVFTINPQSRTYQDNGTAFTARTQLQDLYPGNGNYVEYREAQVKADVESSTSELMLMWSDDDYETWSNARTLDLSSSIPKATRLGGTKKPRAFALTHSANTPMRIEHLKLRVNIS